MIRKILSQFKMSFAIATVILIDLVLSHIKITYFGGVEINPIAYFIGFPNLALLNIAAIFSLFLYEWILKKNGLWDKYSKVFEFLLMFRGAALLIIIYFDIYLMLTSG